MAGKPKKKVSSDSARSSKMVGEFRSGDVAGTAVLAGVTFAQKGLQYAEVDGLAIFEGDIVLGTIDEVQAAADTGGPILQSVGLTGQQFRWPNATIPYEIDSTLPNQQRVSDAIAHWESNTRIRFVLRTAANQAQYPDYVRFQPGGGCSSAVGRRGGRQNITLGSGCSTGNTIHEIGHAVGLWHEQSREDRDSFIQIVWANIDPGMQHNFNQHISDGDDLGAYDFGSIMHYPATAFSINGQATIIPRQALPAGVVMGQRNGLSQGDINGVHAMYPAPTPTRKEIIKEPIKDGIKDIRKDPIKDIRKEPIKDIRKEPVFDTFKEIRKEPIKDIRKDPITDPITTIKEGAFDPGPFPGPRPNPFDQPPAEGSASPFVLGAPSRVGASDAVAAASAEVQQLAEALVALEEQQAALLAAYDAAVQYLNDLQQG